MVKRYIQTNKGQLAGWEAIIILVLIVYSGFITYKWATKPSEANKFEAESKPVMVDVKPGFGGCASVGVERIRDAISVNSEANSVD